MAAVQLPIRLKTGCPPAPGPPHTPLATHHTRSRGITAHPANCFMRPCMLQARHTVHDSLYLRQPAATPCT